MNFILYLSILSVLTFKSIASSSPSSSPSPVNVECDIHSITTNGKIMTFNQLDQLYIRRCLEIITIFREVIIDRCSITSFTALFEGLVRTDFNILTITNTVMNTVVIPNNLVSQGLINMTLSNCNISQFSISSTNKFNIQNLILNNNNLLTFSLNEFSNGQLKYLDLSNNYKLSNLITNLDTHPQYLNLSKSLVNFRSQIKIYQPMKWLDLSYNNLTNLNFLSIEGAGHVDLLILRDNPLNDLQLLVDLKETNKVSNMDIKDVPFKCSLNLTLSWLQMKIKKSDLFESISCYYSTGDKDQQYPVESFGLHFDNQSKIEREIARMTSYFDLQILNNLEITAKFDDKEEKRISIKWTYSLNLPSFTLNLTVTTNDNITPIIVRGTRGEQIVNLTETNRAVQICLSLINSNLTKCTLMPATRLSTKISPNVASLVVVFCGILAVVLCLYVLLSIYPIYLGIRFFRMTYRQRKSSTTQSQFELQTTPTYNNSGFTCQQSAYVEPSKPYIDMHGDYDNSIEQDNIYDETGFRN